MQTFAPFSDPERTASVLDDKRLGKQRVETYQLLLWLHSVSMKNWDQRIMVPRRSGWSHPALSMWSGHERALLGYQGFICREWTGRGYRDTCLDKSEYVVSTVNSDPLSERWPDWWGDDDFHSRHRSNLLWKDESYYSEFFPDEVARPPYSRDLYVNYREYIWPLGRIPVVDRTEEHLSAATRILS